MIRIRRYLVIGPHAVLGRRTGEDVYLADAEQAERLLRAGHLEPLAAGTVTVTVPAPDERMTECRTDPDRVSPQPE